MKNYGRDPDTDVREIIVYEITANNSAAVEFEARAAECRDQADKHQANADRFHEANTQLRGQLVALEAVLGKYEVAA